MYRHMNLEPDGAPGGLGLQGSACLVMNICKMKQKQSKLKAESATTARQS